MKSLILAFLILLVGCGTVLGTEQMSLQRFSNTRIDLMDTLIHFIGYAYSEQEFNEKLLHVTKEMQRLHNLFTTFDEIPGVNNIWYINQQAGISPVQVDPAIISLLQAGIEAYTTTSGMLNISMGSVLDIWHRERISSTPSVPSIEELRAAKLHADINNIVINELEGTVFIQNPNMSIEVGSIAKGFAIELAMQTAREVGLNNFLISAGGDVRMLYAPPHANSWSTGVQNPDTPNNNSALVDVIRTQNMAIFTSGNYQRFFEIEGVRYHHIIDPTTLFPANLYKSITVIHETSIMAEVLTTALYMISIDEGQKLLDELGGYALWITYEGDIIVSTGYSRFSDNF